MSSLFFGKKKAPPKPKADTGAALQGITDHLEMLEKKEAHLAGQILDSKKQAHALNKSKKKTDKTKALQIMRTIKMKEKQQAQIVGTINNMTSQKMAIEGIAMTSATVNVMETTKAALDGAIDLDKAEDTIADVQEGMERAAELADAVSQPMDGGMMPMDEDELMASITRLTLPVLARVPVFAIIVEGGGFVATLRSASPADG